MQVQNVSGEWVDALPISGTLVVNLGKGKFSLPAYRPHPETPTSHGDGHPGVAINATTHRVISPEKGYTPRYPIPFFQIIKRGTVIGDEVVESKSVKHGDVKFG